MSPDLLPGLETVLGEVDAGVVDVEDLVRRTALGDTVERVLAAGIETEEGHQAGVEAVQAGVPLHVPGVEGDEPPVSDDGADLVQDQEAVAAPVLVVEGGEGEGGGGSEGVGREDGPGGREEGRMVHTLQLGRERLV